MTMFAWLKGLQTGVTITSFFLVVLCADALIRHARKRPDGWLMGLGIFCIAFATLIPNTWIMVQFWFAGIEKPAVAPLPLRLGFNSFYLLGGAIFVTLSQQMRFSRGVLFMVWSMLIATLVVLIAFTE